MPQTGQVFMTGGLPARCFALVARRSALRRTCSRRRMESGTWETTHFQASPSSSGGGAVGHGLIVNKETLIKRCPRTKKMPSYKTWADLQSFSRLVLRGGRQRREEPTGRE